MDKPDEKLSPESEEASIISSSSKIDQEESSNIPIEILPITKPSKDQSGATEYRLAFGFPTKDPPKFVPKFARTRTQPNLRSSTRSRLFCDDVSSNITDWSTSYSRDFKADGIKSNSVPRIVHTEPKCEMKKIIRHSYYLPNPISQEKRSIDDNENFNPSLRNFIQSISRK